MTRDTRVLERRLLILAPVGKDATLTEAMLHAEAVQCTACKDMDGLLRELQQGAAAILVAEEALQESDGRLREAIAGQPPWSDLPVLLLTRPGADSAKVAWALAALGNVTLLERPVRVSALASAVRSAMRARRRQYQTRAHLADRERADRRKDEFLATLAHELRNPLAPIRNAVDLLRHGGAAAQTSRVWEMMDRQVTHMVRLVNDLMEVSRITRGKIKLRKEPTDLARVIAGSVETSRPLIEIARHQLTLALPPMPLPVEVDSMRLAQAFSNLLNNAAKYTDPGGRISVAVRPEDGEAVVTVTDTGVGIEPEMLPMVFDMFTQGDARGEHSQSGLGIGLTLVRTLVEMHGGSVVARSDGPGRGSEFEVRVPLGSHAVPAPEAPKPEPEVHGLPRVLVVDDNHDAANSLGAEVRVTHNGPAALDAFASFHPAAVFLDIGMPGMDGYEVAKRLRNGNGHCKAQLIALTGWGQERDRIRTEAAGFDHHLIKPAEIGALRELLASLPAQK